MPTITSFFKGLRFQKRKSIEAPKYKAKADEKPAVEPSWKPKRQSPDELQYSFILEMASAVNSLPIAKEIQINMFQFQQATAITRPAEFNVEFGPRKHTVVEATASTDITLHESPVSVTAEVPVVDMTVAIIEEPEIVSTQVSRVLNIDDFQFIRLLGQGFKCKVFLALDTSTEKLFATKVVPKDGLTLGAHTRLFEEQRVQKVLTNSLWALGLEASFEDTDNFYFVSNHCSGGSLSQRLEQGDCLSDAAKKYIIAELLVSVEDLHNRRIAHCGLKLDNILIDDNGHVTIADFGSAKVFGDNEVRLWEEADFPSVDAARKAPEYNPMDAAAEAPWVWALQHLVEEAHVYARDVFDLGLIAYKLVYGKFPFGLKPHRQTEGQMNEKIRHILLDCSEYDDVVDPLLVNLLQIMLQKDARKGTSISELKSHPFFFDIDWDVVSMRSHNAISKEEVHRFIQPSFINESQLIPPGETYKSGKAPCPWFEFVGPSLLELVGEDQPDSEDDDLDSDENMNSDFDSIPDSDSSSSSLSTAPTPTSSSAPRTLSSEGCAFQSEAGTPESFDPPSDSSLSTSSSSSSSSDASQSPSPHTPDSIYPQTPEVMSDHFPDQELSYLPVPLGSGSSGVFKKARSVAWWSRTNVVQL